MAVFIVPLCLTLKWDTLQRKIGWGLYIAGILVYFASWIPLMVYPDSAWSNSLIGFTAPAFTPLIWLAGIGLMGGWRPYLGLSVVFVGVHLWHWSQVCKLVMGQVVHVCCETFNDKEPPNWAALCFSRCGILPDTPEGCRSAKFITTTHTTSPPLFRIAIL